MPITARYRSNWTGHRQCARHRQKRARKQSLLHRQRARRPIAYRARCYREIERAFPLAYRRRRGNDRQYRWAACPDSPLRQTHPDRYGARHRHWYRPHHPKRDWDAPPRSPELVFPFPTPAHVCDGSLAPARKIPPLSRPDAQQPPFSPARFAQSWYPMISTKPHPQSALFPQSRSYRPQVSVKRILLLSGLNIRGETRVYRKATAFCPVKITLCQGHHCATPTCQSLPETAPAIGSFPPLYPIPRLQLYRLKLD